MEIYLKRIKRTEFDGFMKNVVDRFENNRMIEISDEELEGVSENVVVNGKLIRFSYNVDEYMDIVNSELQTYEKLARVGTKLHKESKDLDGTTIPTNVMYEKEVWTYLSFKVFADVVKKLRLDDDDKMNVDKVERFYFNVKTRSRTGLLFVWSMIDILNSENEEEISRVAFHFIDPVKAIYERAMARNPIILRAFVEAIIRNDCDGRIKNAKYKTKVPKNISCFARINILDAYEYNELVDTMAFQIKEVLRTA